MDTERKKLIKKFLQQNNLKIKNILNIDQAFYHSSYINENDFGFEDNEKLEFLGDSVLALITVEYLYNLFPDKREGDLSRLKSMLVSANALSGFAKKLNLSEYLLLGRGEEQSGGRNRNSLLADTFEAVLGALYLDNGIEQVKKLVIPLLKEYINKIENHEHTRDYKTCFQLFVQQRFKTVPIYHTVREFGPDHAKIFLVEVIINNEVCGKGKGKSKKNAQQKAAKEAIEKFGFEQEDF